MQIGCIAKTDWNTLETATSLKERKWSLPMPLKGKT
jgi:hypothetical protein